MRIQEVDIVIVTPTAPEWLQMTKHLKNPEAIDFPLPSERGSIGRHSVLCCAAGKGQEETASAVTLLIERTRPHSVFLIGIAGGFPQRGIKRGDLVIAHTIHSFDFGKLTAGTFNRRPEMDLNCDRKLLAWAEVVATRRPAEWAKYVLESRPDGGPVSSSVVHQDCYVASSNKVVDDPDHPFFSLLLKHIPEIHAVEMEGVGVGASVRLAQSEQQVAMLMIRGVSDEPGDEAGGGTAGRSAWKQYAASVAAAFTRAVIEELPDVQASAIEASSLSFYAMREAGEHYLRVSSSLRTILNRAEEVAREDGIGIKAIPHLVCACIDTRDNVFHNFLRAKQLNVVDIRSAILGKIERSTLIRGTHPPTLTSGWQITFRLASENAVRRKSLELTDLDVLGASFETRKEFWASLEADGIVPVTELKQHITLEASTPYRPFL